MEKCTQILNLQKRKNIILKNSKKVWNIEKIPDKDYRKGDSCFENLKMRLLQTMRKEKTM